MIWSENEGAKSFPGQRWKYWSTGSHFLINIIFRDSQTCGFKGNWFPEIIFTQNKRTPILTKIKEMGHGATLHKIMWHCSFYITFWPAFFFFETTIWPARKVLFMFLNCFWPGIKFLLFFFFFVTITFWRKNIYILLLLFKKIFLFESFFFSKYHYRFK